jgi:FAR-17a/AIG1-like protein
MASLIFQLIRLAFLTTCFFSVTLWELEPEHLNMICNRFFGRFQFLTHLGLHLTIITLAVSFLESISSSSFFSKKITSNDTVYKINVKTSLSRFSFLSPLKHLLVMASLVVETLLCFIYWSLHFTYPNLLKPANVPFNVPLFTDLCLHFFPMVYIWMEFLFACPQFTPLFWYSGVLGGITFAYIAFAVFVFQSTNKWPYPFFRYLEKLEYLVALFAFATCVNLLIYWMAVRIHVRIYRNNPAVSSVNVNRLSS